MFGRSRETGKNEGVPTEWEDCRTSKQKRYYLRRLNGAFEAKKGSENDRKRSIAMAEVIDKVAEKLEVNEDIISNPVLRKIIRRLIEGIEGIDGEYKDEFNRLMCDQLDMTNLELEDYVEKIANAFNKRMPRLEYNDVLKIINRHKPNTDINSIILGEIIHMGISVNPSDGSLNLQSIRMYENKAEVTNKAYCAMPGKLYKGSMQLRTTTMEWEKQEKVESITQYSSKKSIITYNSGGIELKSEFTEVGRTSKKKIYERDSKHPFIVKCIGIDGKIYYKVLTTPCIDKGLNRPQLLIVKGENSEPEKGVAIFDSREEAVDYFNINREDIMQRVINELYGDPVKKDEDDGTRVHISEFLTEKGFDIVNELQGILARNHQTTASEKLRRVFYDDIDFT